MDRDKSARKKISVLQLGSSTGLYGAERWILALIKHLDKREFLTTVGVIKDNPAQDAPELCTFAAKLGFDTVVFEGAGKLNFSAIRQIRDYLRKHDVDILHTHGYKMDVFGWIAAIGTRCRVVGTPHGWSTNQGFNVQLYEFINRVVFLFHDLVVPLSRDLYAGLEKIPFMRRKLTYIQNGVDLSELDAVESAEPAHIETSAFRVGYIGQLISRKRLHTLLQAFAEAEIPGKRMTLIGEGRESEDLRSLAQKLGIDEQVDFLGFRKDRIRFLKEFDVFVLPSELEGIPRCVLESMACGVPVITSDIPGCRDVVKHEETGLLFELGNSVELRQCLEVISSDRELGRSMSEASADMVRRDYSAQRMADEYAALFRQVSLPGDAIGENG